MPHEARCPATIERRMVTSPFGITTLNMFAVFFGMAPLFAIILLFASGKVAAKVASIAHVR